MRKQRRFHPAGRLTRTNEFERTGRRGRPKRIWEDQAGTMVVYTSRKHFNRKLSRMAMPNKNPPGWYPGSSESSGMIYTRLVHRWIPIYCDSCRGVGYCSEQFRVECSSKRNDGSWSTRSKPLKMNEVMYPARAVYVGSEPRITCRCLGSGGHPRPSVVRELAYQLSISKDGPPSSR